MISAAAFMLFRFGVRVRRRIVRRWVKVKAAVVASEVASSPRLGARPVIVYEYNSEGHHFLGQHRPWGVWRGLRRWAEKAASRLPPGALISVFVNPDNHQMSLVRPWPPVWLCAALLAVLIVSFGLSLPQLFVGFREILDAQRTAITP
jgi:hypothetical protein